MMGNAPGGGHRDEHAEVQRERRARGFLHLAPEAAVEMRHAGHVLDSHPEWRAHTFKNLNYQLVLVVGRCVRFQRGAERLELAGGDFLILCPGDVHIGWGEVDASSSFYYAQFWARPAPSHGGEATSWAGASMGREPITLPLLGSISPAGGVGALFTELIDEWRCRPRHAWTRMHALLTEILVRAARSATARADQPLSGLGRWHRSAEVVRQVLEYLERHQRSEIHAADIERELGYSYPHLCRLFHRATGLTVRVHLQWLRVQQARLLLLDSSQHYSVAQVARVVGFSDAAYFSRVFRKIEGSSPREYLAAAYASRA